MGIDAELIEDVEKENKYHNKKPEIDGHTFDSKLEARYYQKLKLLKKAGEVKKFELQPRFELLAPEDDEVTGRGIYYRADFKIWWKDGKVEVVDCKGSEKTKTYAYKIKKKLLLNKYSKINFREVFEVNGY